MDFLITITLDKVMQLQKITSFKLAAAFLAKDNPFYNIQLRKYYTLGIQKMNLKNTLILKHDV